MHKKTGTGTDRMIHPSDAYFHHLPLTWLSLAGLLASRARLRFTKQDTIRLASGSATKKKSTAPLDRRTHRSCVPVWIPVANALVRGVEGARVAEATPRLSHPLNHSLDRYASPSPFSWGSSTYSITS